MRWLHQAPLFAPANRPRDICILRLSAIGDTCHMVPLIRALQSAWPECRITWIIGRVESQLMSLVPGVELLTVDKRRFVAELARLRGVLASRRFDLLLHMQASMRASLLSTLVRAPIKLGFDRARARELQWLFTNRRIAPRRANTYSTALWDSWTHSVSRSHPPRGTCHCRRMRSPMRARSYPTRSLPCW